MIKKLKRKYAEFLFNKYGWNEGSIPMIYKINPLYSPSLYMMCMGEQMVEWLQQGIKEAEKIQSFKKFQGG